MARLTKANAVGLESASARQSLWTQSRPDSIELAVSYLVPEYLLRIPCNARRALHDKLPDTEQLAFLAVTTKVRTKKHYGSRIFLFFCCSSESSRTADFAQAIISDHLIDCGQPSYLLCMH